MNNLLSEEQTKVIDYLDNLVSTNQQLNRDQFIITIGGYAGTGKTTLLCELRKQLQKSNNLSVAFLTFTGKASSVLKSKIEKNSKFSEDYVGTIHGLIYKPITVWDKKINTFVIIGWVLKDKHEIYHDLFFIDEASMITKSIWDDLLKFGKPIIAVGDHGQLPPIGDNFNLMSKPTFKLETIHRQALNSPIIKLSKFVREEGYIPNKIFSPNVFKISWDNPKRKKIWKNINFKDNNLITLCGFNTTRANLNDLIRSKLEYKNKIPYPGERVVCLKNNHHAGIMNGQIGSVIWVMPEVFGIQRLTTEIDGDYYEVLMAEKCFGEVQYTLYDKTGKENDLLEKYALKHGFLRVSYFDYGYVISVHKSQGSEWDKVILIEQRSKHWDDNYYTRWLYTGLTRSKEKLMIIDNAWL